MSRPRALVAASVCFVLLLTDSSSSSRAAPAGASAAAKEKAAASEAEAEAKFEKLLAKFQQEKSLQPWERMPTIEKFASAPCARTVEFLTKLYAESTNSGIHIAASHALGGIGTLEAIKALVTVGIPLLSDPVSLPEIAVSLDHPMTPEAEDWFVKNAMKSGVRKNPKAAPVLLKTMARLKTPKRIPILVNELKKSSPEVQVVLLEALRFVNDARVARSVTYLLRSRNPEVQVGAYEVLAGYEGKTYRKYFTKGLKSTQWEVRALCVDALSKLGEKTLVKLVSPLLRDRDKRVQISAVRAMLMRGGVEVIEPLIMALEGSDPRVQDDIADALARLTGKNLGPLAAQWESWWAQNKSRKADYKAMSSEEFARLKEEDRVRSKTVYFGLRVLSNNLAFLFDTSESMGEEYTPKKSGSDADGGKKSGKTIVIQRTGKKGGRGSSKSKETKLDVAKKELTKVVTNLRKTQAVDLFPFNTLVSDFVASVLGSQQKRLAKANADVRARINQFVRTRRPAGATNLFGAIRDAMEYPQLDTIYLLSDGAPTEGVTDPAELLAEVEKLNRRRRVKINTISFNPKPHERKLLQALADQNFGVYVER